MALLGSLCAILALAAVASARELQAQHSGGPCSHLRAGSVVAVERSTGGAPLQLGFSDDPHAVGAIAWGAYVDSGHTKSNFGSLRVETSGDAPDALQMRAAGFLEGYLTAEQMFDNHQNMRTYFEKAMNASLEEPMRWVQRQTAWVRRQCARRDRAPSAGREPRFWAAVCLVLQQHDGLAEGYRAAAAAAGGGAGAGAGGRRLSVLSGDDLLFVQSNADLYDIIDWMQPDQRPSWVQSSGAPSSRPGAAGWERLRAAAEADPSSTAARLFSRVALSGRCTALVKLDAGLRDLWLGHSTWDTYTAMLRIFKHYQFSLSELAPAANQMSFSSYPGELFSDDDFYLLSSGLAVLQTTNKIFNDELFDRLSTSTVPSWLRVRAANHLASTGEEWAGVVKTLNSGTYNNQYLVVNLNLFEPGQDLRAGLLTVVEQIPGLVMSGDATDRLRLGYFPSYNVPWFAEIYEASGYPDFISRVEKWGQHFSRTTHWLSYDQTPRAAIFRRDQGQVVDLESMAALLRSNNWRHDPLSEGHPIAAICGRGDLDPENPVPRGCFDTKVTSFHLARNLTAWAVNGPTRGGGGSMGSRGPMLPPYSWRREFPRAEHPELQHLGQPERFDFAFERMAPGELGGCRLDAAAALRRGSNVLSSDGSRGSSNAGKATAAA